MSSKAASDSAGESEHKTAASDDKTDKATSKPHAPHAEPPRVLASFWKLPQELQQQIVSMACSPPSSARSSIPARSSDCTGTMNRLSQSGRQFYTLATPLLYANVRITRPSALRQFQQALASRPALGRLVKTLHIGPTEALPARWWPMSKRTPSDAASLQIEVNLVNSLGDRRRPCWAYSSHNLSTKTVPDGHPEYRKAIAAALRAASADLVVDLHHEDKDHSGGHIGWDAWHVRVLEVQAAMELYCLDMHQRDLQEMKKTGRTSFVQLKTRYARLAVGREPGDRSGEGLEAAPLLHLSRSQLYQRMSRAGAPTDNFNHPLIFAHSGLNWIADGPHGTEHRGLAPNEELEEEQDPADIFAWPSSSRHDPSAHVWGPALIHPADLSDPLDPAIPGTATVGGNLALARSVLSLTPLISCLSLTGFLECSVLGQRAPPAFQALRFASFGPPPTGWYFSHQCHGSMFKDLEKLRICGRVPGPQEIQDIVGDGTFVKLRELEWSVVKPVDDGDPESGVLMCILEQLMGFDEENAPTVAEIEAAGQRLKRSRAVYEEDEEEKEEGEGKIDSSLSSQDRARSGSPPPTSSQQRKVLFIKASLHTDDADTAIDMAPTNKMAEAWAEGKAVPGQRHRLQIFRHEKSERRPGRTWPINEEMEDLFEEGRRFWEESAG